MSPEEKGFDTIVVFQRPAADGNIGIGFKKASQFGKCGEGQSVIAIANASGIKRTRAESPTYQDENLSVIRLHRGAHSALVAKAHGKKARTSIFGGELVQAEVYAALDSSSFTKMDFEPGPPLLEAKILGSNRKNEGRVH